MIGMEKGHRIECRNDGIKRFYEYCKANDFSSGCGALRIIIHLASAEKFELKYDEVSCRPFAKISDILMRLQTSKAACFAWKRKRFGRIAMIFLNHATFGRIVQGFSMTSWRATRNG